MSNERIPMVEEGERVAIFNNVTNKVRDDLIKTIREGSQVSVAAACFSMSVFCFRTSSQNMLT